MNIQQKTKRTMQIQNLRKALAKYPILSQNKTHISAKLDETRELGKNANDSLSNAKTNENQTQNFSIEAGLFEQKYELGKKIGQGANGLVRQCFEKFKKKKYAVKTMRIDDQHISPLKKNFLEVSSLHHPNIIQFKALYLDMKKHQSYLVMDYFTYPNLVTYFNKLEPENRQQELKWIFSQILKGIQYLHYKNVCHRDIKPENILINSKQKSIKIIDFGSSKCFLKNKKKVDMLTNAGSLDYSAPEIFIGGGYSQKCDLWSIGVSLYQLVTRRMPFQSQFHAEKIKKIKNSQPDFQLDQFKNYSKFLKDLIRRLLKKNITQRPSAEQALNNLWFQRSFFEDRTSKSCDTPRKQQTTEINQSNKLKIKRRLRTFNPAMLSLKQDVKKINGANYYRIQTY